MHFNLITNLQNILINIHIQNIVQQLYEIIE